MSQVLIWGVGLLGLVFVAEAIYALFFRNFGLVPFRIALDIPGVDPALVWSIYFDRANDWNSVTERLSFEVVSETPRMLRIRSRLRGSQDKPVTTLIRVDNHQPERCSRATVIEVDGAPVPQGKQTYEQFELHPSAHGARIEIEATMPVRGWVWIPVHRRNLRRIYEDLRMACLRKAGIAFEVRSLPFWRPA